MWLEERIKTEGERTHEALAELKASISLKVHVQCITRTIYELSKVARSVQLRRTVLKSTHDGEYSLQHAL